MKQEWILFLEVWLITHGLALVYFNFPDLIHTSWGWSWGVPISAHLHLAQFSLSSLTLPTKFRLWHFWQNLTVSTLSTECGMSTISKILNFAEFWTNVSRTNMDKCYGHKFPEDSCILGKLKIVWRFGNYIH